MNEHAQVLLDTFGPLSAGMAGHILLMNLLAPAAALLGASLQVRMPRGTQWLAAATAAQLLLLWGWHAPQSLAAAMERSSLHLAMLLSLTLAAVWFWTAVVKAATQHPWRAIWALLVTSKLFCLLGILLTFATRPLYPAMAHHGVPANDPLADQQLAGLLMLIACPLSYLVAAVVVASRWLAPVSQDRHHAEDAKVA